MSRCTRRRFLSGLAGVTGAMYLDWPARAAAMKDITIEKVESIPLNYPTAGRFKFFEGPHGEPLGRQTSVVKIIASDGTIGWGQSVPTHKWSYETLETVHTTIERYLTPVLLGRNVFDVESIESAMNRIIAPAFSIGQPICKAGIDLALFDLVGKLLGQTAQQRWGRIGRKKITLSWTLNPRKLDEIPGLIEQGRNLGYRNFNVKVSPDPDFDVEMCRMVRELVPDGFLWADANGGYDETTALAVAPKLAEAGADVLEQPLKPNRFSGYRKLKKLGALPVLMDEGVVSTAELEQFIELGMIDGLAMKPARCGGLTEARRQIEMVLDHGLMWLGSGLTDPDISLAASLLLYGAYDQAKPCALNGPQFLSRLSILKQPFEAVGGEMMLPTGVGLGVEVDEAKLRAHQAQLF